MNKGTKTDKVYFSVKGQVVIPRWLRKQFEIEAGTRAHVTATPQGILIQPITRAFIRSLRGSLRHLPLMETLQEMKREEKER
jgi:bifunctional DNA-binding transcriptional regulator/antitoxin component of YhaV-PrlF toxin-antitoxin module